MRGCLALTSPTGEEVPAGGLSAAQLAELLALIQAQAAVRDQLTETAIAAVLAAFSAITDFWDTAQTKKAVAAAVKAVQASQKRMASVTDAYLARSTSLIGDRRFTGVGAVDISKLRRELPQDVIDLLAKAPRTNAGAGPDLGNEASSIISKAMGSVKALDPGAVYGRLADAYRYRVATDLMDDATARRYVEERARVVVDTDVMLADRAQAGKFFETRKPNGIKGYRRVIHPELGSGGPVCGLCVVAADRIYSFKELMPVHSRCRCTVAAIGAKDDPGFRLNSADLKKIYEAAGDVGNKSGRTRSTTAGKQLKQIRVEVTEHGELGPWLINPTKRFRGPREAAMTKSSDPADRVLAQLEALHAELDTLLLQKDAGMLVDKPIKWRRNKIEELNALIPGG